MGEETGRARSRSRPPADARLGGRRRRRLPVRPGVLLALVVAIVAAFLYARPLSSYLDTRRQLEARRAEVAELRAERARVTSRLQASSSVEALARDARRIGQVRPGEQLFIVKGIDAWRRQQAAAG